MRKLLLASYYFQGREWSRREKSPSIAHKRQRPDSVGSNNTETAMPSGATFTVALLRPEIASGTYNFRLDRAGGVEDPPPRVASPAEEGSDGKLGTSPIRGVAVEDAAFFLPNGQVVVQLLQRLQMGGLRVVEKRTVQLTKAQVRHLFRYQQEQFKGRKEFEEYVTGLTLGPVLALLLEAPAGSTHSATLKLQQLVGDSDPVVARKRALAAGIQPTEWPLRALCGLNSLQNGIHCSETLYCAYRERYALFPRKNPPCERAVVVLLPALLGAWSETEKTLRAKLGSEGIIVMHESQRVLTAADLSDLAEFHANISEVDRMIYVNTLELVASEGKPAKCWIVEGLALGSKLRALVLGPPAIDEARRCFPETFRGQQPSSFKSLPHVLTSEDLVTGLESGVFVSYDERLVRRMCEDEDHHVQRTYGMIKPGTANDPVAVKAIQDAIRAFGFTILQQRRLRLSRAQAEAFYGEHRGKGFFERLMAFMTSDEVIAMELEREHAIIAWRGLMGPTNALVAQKTHPQSLRGRFGVDGTRNATHGSDAPGSAARELEFFFGRSKTSDRPLIKSVRTLATAPLPAPLHASDKTLDTLLAEGLSHLIQNQLEDPLEACRWLGTWLLEQNHILKAEHIPVTARPGASCTGTASLGSKPKPVAARGLAKQVSEKLFRADRQVVAVGTEDGATPPNLRQSFYETLAARVNEHFPGRFLVVDVGAMWSQQQPRDAHAAVATLVQQLSAAGKRRVLLLDFPLWSVEFCNAYQDRADGWSLSLVVHASATDADPAKKQQPAHVDTWRKQGMWLNVAALRQPLAPRGLDALLHKVFEPMVVPVHDPHHLVSVAQWEQMGQRFGFVVLDFDRLVLQRAAQEGRSDGEFTTLSRTRATMPSQVVIDLVREAVGGYPAAQASEQPASQRFMLVGFPWDNLEPAAFAQALGLPHCVVAVTKVRHAGGASAAPQPSIWVNWFTKHGLVEQLHVGEQATLDATMTRVLAPRVGLCVGGDSSAHEAMIAMADELGMSCIHMPALTTPNATIETAIQQLQRIILRPTVGRETFLVTGFPGTTDALALFQQQVCSPRFVLHDALTDGDKRTVITSASSTPLQAFLDCLPPSCAVQAFGGGGSAGDDEAVDPSSVVSASLPEWRGLFFGKKVAFVVGDLALVESAKLRNAVQRSHVLLDLRQATDLASGQPVAQTVAALSDQAQQVAWVQHLVARAHGARCLVLGAPESPAFFQALEQAVGHALDRILILKHLPVQPPPRIRSEDEDYYSDDEEELERQRQWKRQQALRPELEQVVQYYQASKAQRRSVRVPVVSVIKFLHMHPRVLDSIASAVRPQLVAVVGHAHSFYRQALQLVSCNHQIGRLDVQEWVHEACLEDKQPVASNPTHQLVVDRLQAIVEKSAHSVYFVDGFPRQVADDPTSPPTAPYVAEQVQQLEQRVGAMSLLIQFTTSMEVLEERKPDNVTRNELEDAQDSLDAQTDGLAEYFQQHKHRKVVSVTCERELVDAVEAVETALLKWGTSLYA